MRGDTKIGSIGRMERSLSRGCFRCDRCDWSVRSRKAGRGKDSFISSSSQNIEKPERCRLHSCCVRLYHGTSRGNRLWLVPYGFVRLRRAQRLLLRRKESPNMFLVVVSPLSPFSFPSPCRCFGIAGAFLCGHLRLLDDDACLVSAHY